ncbi:hypothetical protein AVEN_188997-1 [Araneus ventricosus]|uniref:Uncharacterized protein n=1 Tax=Araneus ventricosus TaxID=182803 RepID=A0A4Y2UTK1_ARAVE|nr:hypothetical protein AVEN_188997-1 [Araneus ventricosus]
MYREQSSVMQHVLTTPGETCERIKSSRRVRFIQVCWVVVNFKWKVVLEKPHVAAKFWCGIVMDHLIKGSFAGILERTTDRAVAILRNGILAKRFFSQFESWH